jgi:hypothetical protein
MIQKSKKLFIYNIFFPKSFSEKYGHIGYSYLNVPNGWIDIVKEAIIKIEKEMWPQKYLPLFVKRLIHYLATSNNIYRINSEWFNNLRSKLTKNQLITDIKDKYAGLRIYGYFNREIDKIIEDASDRCDNTCESCGSTQDVKIVGKNWIENLCYKCRNDKYI